MSVSDVSGKAIANLATEELKHPAPVFHGDTLFCESEVLEAKESRSKPDRGTVKVHTRVLNQDGVLVAEFKRLVLVPRRRGAGLRGGRRRTRRWTIIRRPTAARTAPARVACSARPAPELQERETHSEIHDRPDEERETGDLGGGGRRAHPARRRRLVRRLRRGVRPPVPAAGRRRDVRAALGRQAAQLVPRARPTRATSRASRTARSSAPATSTTPARRTTGATPPRCGRRSRACSAARCGGGRCTSSRSPWARWARTRATSASSSRTRPTWRSTCGS